MASPETERAELARVQAKIDATENEIVSVEQQQSTARGRKLAYLRTKATQLRKKEEELRKEKGQLRERSKGAGAGLGPGSAAAVRLAGIDDMVMTTLAHSVADRLTDTLPEKIAAILNLQQKEFPITNASQCDSKARRYIEDSLPKKFEFSSCCSAPCCLDPPPEPCTPEVFTWPKPLDEDAPENIVSAMKWLQRDLAPEGVVVLPVQQVGWLHGVVSLGSSDSLGIRLSKTDYIFVMEDVWSYCQERYGIKIEGHKLMAGSSDSLRSVLEELLTKGIVGFYEAKTPGAMKKDWQKVRAQALVQYLAANQMQNWPEADVVVVYGDFNAHHTVHAGRKDFQGCRPSLHVTAPAIPAKQPPLATLNEDAPLMDASRGADGAATSRGADGVTASRGADGATTGFIKKLLGMRRTVAMRPPPSGGSSNSGAAGDASSGAGGAGAAAGSGGAADSGTTAGSGGAAGSGKTAGSGGAAGSGKTAGSGGAADSSGAGRGGRAAGFEGSVAAPHGNDDEQEGACVTFSDDASSDAQSTDEGLLEAARDNASAQRWLSVMRLPQMYEGMGLGAPPTSFTPPSMEQYVASFGSC